MSRIISGWIVATAGLAWTAGLAAGAVQAQTLVADEIRAPYPDAVIVRRGPYRAMPPVTRPADMEGGYAEEVVPPFEVVRIVRATGFEPLGPPVRRRWVYTMSAINPDGDDGRVVLDAHTGRIMRFLPAEISDAEVVGTYGPPGLPPPGRMQRADVHNLRPPLPVPKVAKRTPPLPAPKPEAAREVAGSQPKSQPQSQPQSSPGQPQAAEPRTVGAASPGQQQAAAPVAARPVEAKPSVQLLPTADMPPVQGFE